jgi:hypothetical protein
VTNALPTALLAYLMYWGVYVIINKPKSREGDGGWEREKERKKERKACPVGNKMSPRSATKLLISLKARRY